MAHFEVKDDYLVINSKKVQIERRLVNHLLLNFYVENPRVYSAWNSRELNSVDQKDIEEKMQQMEHVKGLKNSIEANGSILEPLYVRDGDYTVFDGNSRLAAFRLLAKKDPGKWIEIPCVMLPLDITELEINKLLGTLHIVGRKDWQPFEQAGYLYRIHSEGMSIESIAKEIGISKKEIDDMIKTYTIMCEQGDAEASKWSYYFELQKNRGFRNITSEINIGFRNKIFDDIKGNKFEKAEQIRNITKIDKMKNKVKRKVIDAYVKGDIDFEDVLEEALEEGVDNSIIQKVSKFKSSIADIEKIKKNYEKMNDTEKGKFKYDLNRIQKSLEKIIKDIDK